MSGAELPLAIAGVALAWRGILDMASLLSTLCRDDDEDRSFVHLQVMTARSWFANWGEYHGVEAADGGTLARCTEDDRALIQKVIEAFKERTEALMRRLRRYADVECSEKDGGKGAGGGSEGAAKGSTKVGIKTDKDRARDSRLKLQFKKRWKKVPWNVKDREAVSEYLTEMTLAQNMLEKLTWFAMFSKPVCRQQAQSAVSLLTVENNTNGPPLQHVCDLCKMHSLQSSKAAFANANGTAVPAGSGCREAGLGALVARAVRSFDDFDLIDRVRHLALEAHYTDIRHDLCEELNAFCQMRAALLKIETGWDPTDCSNELCAAALYACAEQPKLIYIWDQGAKAKGQPEKQVGRLVYSLLKQCLMCKTGGSVRDSPALQEFDDSRIDIDSEMTESLEAAVELLELLLVHSGPANNDRPLLIILSGLEHLPGEGIMGVIGRALVKALCSVYNKRKAARLATKILWLTQGRGRSLKELESTGVVRLLDDMPEFKDNLLLSARISLGSGSEDWESQ